MPLRNGLVTHFPEARMSRNDSCETVGRAVPARRSQYSIYPHWRYQITIQCVVRFPAAYAISYSGAVGHRALPEQSSV